MEQDDLFEHYFWAERTCNGCGERHFIHTKVYGNKKGDFVREDHECDAVDFIRSPEIQMVKHRNFQEDSIIRPSASHFKKLIWEEEKWIIFGF